MARIRSIKPEIRTSEKVNSWPIELRYFWVLLWGYCDDYGRGKDNARLIEADAFPLDDAVEVTTVSEWMEILAEADVIRRYEVDGKRYFYVTNWTEHQKVQHPSKSPIPAPPESFGNPHEGSVSASVETHPQGEGSREGSREGEATALSPNCPRHPGGTDNPCHACKTARIKSEAAANEPRATNPGIITPAECVQHPGRPARGCDRCAEEAESAA